MRKHFHVSNRAILRGALVIYFGLSLVEIIERVYFNKK
jgi:hypothetical protein